MFYRLRFDAYVGAILKRCSYDTSAALDFWPVGATPEWVRKGHRPRFEKRYFAGLNIRQAEAKYNKMLDTARKYLEEMDVPNEYYERMISISSQEIEYLREDEIDNHFTGLLPAYDEWIIAKCGPKLTKSELTTWIEESAKEQFDGNGDEALIRRLSKIHDDYFQCYYPIMKAAQRAKYMEIFPRQ